MGRYIIPLFRRRGFSNALHSVADIDIKASLLASNVAKDYSAIGVVGDCVRLYVQLLFQLLFNAKYGRTQFKTRDGYSVRWGQLCLAKDERHLDA